MTPGFVVIPGDKRPVTIEHAWIGRERSATPLLVFLHEGLGSLARWHGWPQSACDALGCRGLVFSREGYGRSTPRPHDEAWTASYLHRQALQALPQLFAALEIDSAREPVWLVGHSDGGSIALIFAASFPAHTAGVIALAPHIMVEDVSIASIERARDAFRDTDLAVRLRKYHADPVSAFGGWCGVWLSPEFRRWSIEDMLRGVRCPVLAVQGDCDEYGTLAQIDGLARRAPNVQKRVLAGHEHALPRDAPEVLTQLIGEFVAQHTPTQRGGESQ